jgi:hypothetical protein
MLCYDVIGDIHGQAEKLKALLRKLGYREGATWRPPAGHQAVFLGDLIDRGPAQLEAVNIVRRMRDAGDALCVMGNHEFNAIGYATPRPDEPGEYLRRHNSKNMAQHREFLAQAVEGSALYLDLLDWFKTLPPYLDLVVIRVVHAWWNQAYVDLVSREFWNGEHMDRACLYATYDKGSPQWAAMEGLVKGLETPLPDQASFLDHDGFKRHKVRTRWWLKAPATYRDIAIVDQRDLAGIPASPVPPGTLPERAHGAPIFIGHYWMRGFPSPQAADVACVDYSAAADGPLVAYRWQGETTLTDSHFVLSTQT